MNPAGLLLHFDRLAEAPGAVASLRRLILDLAVRGKLVEQSTDDKAADQNTRESAEVKNKRFAEVKIGEPPYKLPANWKWIQLGDRLRMVNGRAFKPTDWLPNGLPIVRIQNLNNENAPFNYCDEEVVEDRHVIDNGDFLISWSGTPGTSFGAFIWRRQRAALNQHIFKCFQIGNAYLDRFLQIAINGRLDEMISQAHGGVGLQHITKGKLENLLLSLPPLAEQHRIVAKVDELMALCDRLEAAQAQRERRRDRLAAASLNRLNRPDDDAAAFRAHARFHLDHLPRFTVRPDQIPALRQTILNLAIRGRLVPQDPKDEPAPTYRTLEASERNDRLNISLPVGWRWAAVKDVAESRLGKMLDKAKNSGKSYQYVRNTNVHWYDIRLDDLKTMQIESSEIDKFLLRSGDVLICEGGHGIGRSAVWKNGNGEIVFQKALHRVRPGRLLNSYFFAHCVFVYFNAGILANYYTGVGIPHFTGVALSKLVFPLPPLAEQRRVVAKVDELMGLCDKLESQLTTAQTESRRLLEAVLHEALAPKS